MSFVSKAILWDRGVCHHTVSAQRFYPEKLHKSCSGVLMSVLSSAVRPDVSHRYCPKEMMEVGHSVFVF